MKWKKGSHRVGKALQVLPLLLGMILLISAPPVHAVNPAWIAAGSANADTNTASWVANPSVNPSTYAGGILALISVVVVNSQNVNIGITSITDTAGLSWVFVSSVNNPYTNSGQLTEGQLELWSTNVPSNEAATSDTITVNFANSVTVGVLLIDAVTGFSQPYSDINTGQHSYINNVSPFVASYNLAVTQSYGSPSLTLVAMGMTGKYAQGCGANDATSVPSGTSPLQGSGIEMTNCYLIANSGEVYNSAGGSTTFTGTFTSGNSAAFNTGSGYMSNDAEIVWSLEPTPTSTTTYVPPTSTQLQYWYFPILFMGLYDMVFLTVGFLNRVSTKASIYLLLTGLLMGSVFSESVGLSTLPLVVITLITYIIYIYRIRTSSR